MKKIICMILILSFIFSFTACGKKKDVDDKETNTPTTSEVTEETEGESKETINGTEPTTGTIATDGTTVSTESKNETTEGSKGTTPPKSETTPSTGTTPPSTTNPPTTNPPATNPPTTPPSTVKTCNHSNTEVRNKKDATTSSDGYTGDTYCKDCGKLISSGSSIPKIKQTYTAIHDYYDIEMEIFRLINEERAKNGVAQLVWDEELYAGTKIRAQEYPQTWSHTRPNGEKFVTAITENSNYTTMDFECWGENLNSSNGYTEAMETAKYLFTKWYDSTGHRANMLDSGFTHTAISVVNIGPAYFSVANIFIGK